MSEDGDIRNFALTRQYESDAYYAIGRFVVRWSAFVRAFEGQISRLEDIVPYSLNDAPVPPKKDSFGARFAYLIRLCCVEFPKNREAVLLRKEVAFLNKAKRIRDALAHQWVSLPFWNNRNRMIEVTSFKTGREIPPFTVEDLLEMCSHLDMIDCVVSDAASAISRRLAFGPRRQGVHPFQQS